MIKHERFPIAAFTDDRVISIEHILCPSSPVAAAFPPGLSTSVRLWGGRSDVATLEMVSTCRGDQHGGPGKIEPLKIEWLISYSREFTAGILKGWL